MPDRPLGFAETLGGIEVLTVELRVEVFGILADKGDKRLHDRVRALYRHEKRHPSGYGSQSQILTLLRMLDQPAAHGFEPKDMTMVHDQVLIDERMPPLTTHGVLLHKTLKQDKEQSDIVGKGRCDHCSKITLAVQCHLDAQPGVSVLWQGFGPARARAQHVSVAGHGRIT